MLRPLRSLVCQLGLALAVGAALAAPLAPPAFAESPISVTGVRFANVDRFPRWMRVITAHYQDLRTATEQCRLGSQMYCYLINYEQYLVGLRPETPLEQIAKVNLYVNQFDYEEDSRNFGEVDYWATPLEFFQANGDCEDFAIAKYFALRRLGFSDGDLRIVVVHDTARNVQHAYLRVTINGHRLALDSVTNDINFESDLGQYTPIYSLNAEAWWLHDQRFLNVGIPSAGQ